MKLMFKFLFVGLLFLPSLKSVSARQASTSTDYSDLIADYREEILKRMKKFNVRGLSIALVDEKKIVWAEGFGYSDLEKGIPADSNTVYGIGSITKLFTATAVMQLREEGQLDLDKRIQTYLPDFEIKSRNHEVDIITPRNMLTHHSGLPSDIFSGMAKKDADPFTDVLDLVRNEWMPFPPNYVHSYSNVAFSLLGHAVQEISRLNYTEYIEQKIFTPLNMKKSGFDWKKLEKVSSTYDEKGINSMEYDLRAVPAGRIYSNVIDMASFIKAHLNEEAKILNGESMESIFTVQNGNVPMDFEQEIGLTWNLRKNKNRGRRWYHDGATINYRAQIEINRESKLGAVILSNSRNGDRITSLTSTILYEAAKLKNVVPLPKTRKQSSNANAELRYKFENAESVHANYLGNYVLPSNGVDLSTFLKNDRLFLKMGSFKGLLTESENGLFSGKIILLGIIPLNVDGYKIAFVKIDGRKLIVRVYDDGRIRMQGELIEKTNQFYGWDTMVGKYRLANLAKNEFPIFDNFELFVNDGNLNLSLMSTPDNSKLNFILIPFSGTKSIIAGIGRYGGAVVEIEESNSEKTVRLFGIKLQRD